MEMISNREGDMGRWRKSREMSEMTSLTSLQWNTNPTLLFGAVSHAVSLLGAYPRHHVAAQMSLRN